VPSLLKYAGPHDGMHITYTDRMCISQKVVALFENDALMENKAIPVLGTIGIDERGLFLSRMVL
jgi:hypothetical protein